MNDEDDRTTILIADGHAFLREGLRELLKTQEDMRVVSGAAGYCPGRHRHARRRRNDHSEPDP